MPEEFARILYAGVLPNIGTFVPAVGGFKKWIVSGTYVPEWSEQGDLVLKRANVEAFTRAVSFDYDRFALAAQESRIVALSEREKFGVIGWPLLKQYYSAFFAAHAIMRCRGAGIVRIDAEQSAAISLILQSYLGDDAKLRPGNYYYSASKGDQDRNGELTISFAASKDGKGAHEGFWDRFVKYLEFEADRAVTDGLPDNQDFVSYSLQIKESIMSGGAVWISKIRNEINYSHAHQSWMPLNKKSISNTSLPKSLKGFISNCRLDVSRSKEPIRAFFCVCCYMSELNLQIASRIAERSKAGGTFGQRWGRLLGLTQV